MSDPKLSGTSWDQNLPIASTWCGVIISSLSTPSTFFWGHRCEHRHGPEHIKDCLYVRSCHDRFQVGDRQGTRRGNSKNSTFIRKKSSPNPAFPPRTSHSTDVSTVTSLLPAVCTSCFGKNLLLRKWVLADQAKARMESKSCQSLGTWCGLLGWGLFPGFELYALDLETHLHRF